MSPLNIVLLVIWAISALAVVILVLMHSGKGTGVSDMIASSLYNSSAASGVWEKKPGSFNGYCFDCVCSNHPYFCNHVPSRHVLRFFISDKTSTFIGSC